MDAILRYRGRVITATAVTAIQALIAAHPGASRRALSEHLCRLWDWRQPNGALCAMVCRGLLLALHRAGHLTLPPVRWVNPNPLARRGRERRPPAPVPVEAAPVCLPLAALRPLTIQEVRGTPAEAVVNSLVAQYHPLGYTHPVGEQLKYLVTANGRPLACLVWASAPRHLGPRDRFIGWTAEARRRQLRLLAYNTRFLILPWVRVPHLASHLLGQMARVVPADWQRRYGHPVVFLETFVDPTRSRGTCYRAANWVVLGQTTGRGKNAPSKRPTRSRKLILGYPLTPGFRAVLGGPA